MVRSVAARGGLAPAFQMPFAFRDSARYVGLLEAHRATGLRDAHERGRERSPWVAEPRA